MRPLDRRGWGWVTALLLVGTIEPSVGADRIFRCEANGKVTYSDRGCADASDATEVQPGRLNSYSSEHVAANPRTEKPESARAPRREALSESIAAEQRRAKQRCDRLADRLTAIEVKLRRGYTVDQGERLKDQRRQIEQQRRTERC